jgi:hypothetical protein
VTITTTFQSAFAVLDWLTSGGAREEDVAAAMFALWPDWDKCRGLATGCACSFCRSRTEPQHEPIARVDHAEMVRDDLQWLSCLPDHKRAMLADYEGDLLAELDEVSA